MIDKELMGSGSLEFIRGLRESLIIESENPQYQFIIVANPQDPTSPYSLFKVIEED